MGSEWKEYKFAEIVKVSGGGTPKTDIEEYWNGNIQWLTPTEVTNFNGRFVSKTSRTITEKGLSESSTKLLPPGTVLMTSRATIGYAVINKVPMATNQGFINIICGEKINNLFLLYWIKQNRKLLNDLANGTTFMELSKKVFKDIVIKLPPLPEQQKIASILSAFDDKIELNNEMNKTLEEIAQAIFKHWFIDFEFPNENGEPYKSSGGEFVDSELGPIPKGWKVVNLREILDNICDSVKPGKEIEGLPYVPIDIIERKSIALKQFKSWEEAQSSLIKFKKDDILLGAMRVYFHKVTIAPCEGVTRKTCFVLRPKKRFDLAYALLLIFQDNTIKFADSHSKGTTIPYAVWDNGLAEMKIILPMEKIRQRFNEVLYPMLSKIRNCIFENLTLSQIRDTLLPKLISGEIRVM